MKQELVLAAIVFIIVALIILSMSVWVEYLTLTPNQITATYGAEMFFRQLTAVSTPIP